MEKLKELITKWLKKSGLKLNHDKTNLGLFHKQETAPIRIKIGDTMVLSKSEINALRVIFNSKLQWSNHVLKAIVKANTALNVIKIIRKVFNSTELLQLLTNYY
jgi:hypothetical protein